jgi:hypothetical protein
VDTAVTKLVPITKNEFSAKSWQRATNNFFAAKDSYCPISAPETLEAALKLPVGFIKDGDDFTLVAIQGVTQDQNLYIGPKGNWYITYKPRLYRCYPFTMAVNSENHDELIFCFDEESELLEDSVEHNPFFLENGDFPEDISKMINFLRHHYADMHQTRKYCDVLKGLDLFTSLEVKFELDGTEHKIDGLYTIDESALQKLSEEKFLSLRNSGLLPLVYTQLLSLKNFDSLIKIAKIRLPAMNRSAPLEELFAGNDEGTISFDNI